MENPEMHMGMDTSIFQRELSRGVQGIEGPSAVKMQASRGMATEAKC